MFFRDDKPTSCQQDKLVYDKDATGAQALP